MIWTGNKTDLLFNTQNSYFKWRKYKKFTRMYWIVSLINCLMYVHTWNKHGLRHYQTDHSLNKHCVTSPMHCLLLPWLTYYSVEFEAKESDYVQQVREAVAMVENATLEKDQAELECHQKGRECEQLQEVINRRLNDIGVHARQEVRSVATLPIHVQMWQSDLN